VTPAAIFMPSKDLDTTSLVERIPCLPLARADQGADLIGCPALAGVAVRGFFDPDEGWIHGD